MGHKFNSDREYRLLQQRLDRNVTGAPDSPVFMQILKLLFSPEEAKLARQIPGSPTPIDIISEKVNIPVDELNSKMSEMAQRGIVIDLLLNGKRYFSLPPVVIGFFEFTFMRTRDNVPMTELAKLFDQYMHENDRFARSVFQGQTQIGRSLVREEAITEENYTEILDWERASHIIKSASAIAVSLCACRHKASHMGHACDRPQEVCLTFNYSADMLTRNGMGRTITTDEAMRILLMCKEQGLAQTGDNVQNDVSYMCNCCGCCCGMIDAIKTFDIRNAIVTSNWIMEVDSAKCKGCGKCVQVCPVDAIELVAGENLNRKQKLAKVDKTLCLGCGVCYSVCKSGGITFQSRAQRVYTPETVFDRIISMAIERGKLAHLLFEKPEKLSHRALGRIFHIIEKSPPYKAAMAIKPLRSKYLNTLVKEAKKRNDLS